MAETNAIYDMNKYSVLILHITSICLNKMTSHFNIAKRYMKKYDIDIPKLPLDLNYHIMTFLIEEKDDDMYIINDKKEGIWTEKTVRTHNIGEYILGEKHGMWKGLWPNDRVKERGYYNYGLKIGKWENWWENGRLKESGVYKNDKKEGLWVERWYYTVSENHNGQFFFKNHMKSMRSYKNGRSDGAFFSWYGIGKLEECGNYFMGKKVGKWEKWWDNNNLKEMCNYTCDMKYGWYKEFWECGQLKEEGHYEFDLKKRTEERRVGKEGRSQMAGAKIKKKTKEERIK